MYKYFHPEWTSSITALAKPPMCILRCYREYRILYGNNNFNFITSCCITFKGWQLMAEVGFDS